MKLSTRSQYGTRALLDLALHGNGEPVQLKSIARRQQISRPYLEHLVASMVGAGILRSARGAQGGVWLARSPRDIKLIEVVSLLEGSMALVGCLDGQGNCPRSGACAPQDIWDDMRKAMLGVLESTTLQDLVDRHKEKEQQQSAMYYI